MLDKKIYLMIIVVCSFVLYNTSVFSQDSSSSTLTTDQDSKEIETQSDSSVQKNTPAEVEKRDVEKKEQSSEPTTQKETEKQETTTTNKENELNQAKEQKQDQQTVKEQKPSVVQTPEEAILPKKDVEQLFSDDISVQLDLGLATHIKVSSDSLLRSELSGISLFVKLKNFSSDLALLINSRYSSIIAYTGSKQTRFNARIENISVGSSVKYKLNKHFSVLGGLDLGVSYGKKYVLSDDDSSFIKFLIGGISAINYSCNFNPNLNVGFKFNINLGPVSNLQSLLYIGLNF